MRGGFSLRNGFKKEHRMKTILMVDDEEDIDQLILQKFRYAIKEKAMAFLFARDGKTALELLENHSSPIHMVLTDINMPLMNGIELLLKIKSKFPTLKVLMMSAYTDPNNTALAKSAGADGFISKPIDLHYLENLLKKTLNAEASH